MRVRSLIVILFLGVLLAVPQKGSALQNNEILEDVIIYAMPYDFDEYSVYTADSYSTAQWVSAIYTSLFKRSSDNDHNWIPELATVMPEISSEGLEFIIQIRDDAYFSNGHHLNAKDIEFSFNVILSPAINTNTYGAYIDYLDNSSIEVLSDYSVKFKFLERTSFPYNLLSFPIVHKGTYAEIYERCNDGVKEDCNWNEPNGEFTLSAGPFMMHTIDNTHEIVTLKANPYYFDAEKVKTDVIIFQKLADKDAAISALASGLIDILDSQYVPGINEIAGLDGVSEAFVGDPSHQEIALNHLNPYWGTGEMIPGNENASDQERYDDALLVRKAMSHTVDRQFAVDEIMEGLASAAATVMPPASLGWDSSLIPRNFSIDVARNYMEMAGFDYSLLGPEKEDGTFSSTFFNITVMSPSTCPARNQWDANYVLELPKTGIGVKEHVATGWGVIVPRTFGYGEEYSHLSDKQDLSKFPLPPSYDDGGFDIFFVGYGWSLDWNPSSLYDTDGRCDTGDCGNFYNFDIEEKYTNIGKLVRSYIGTLDYNLRMDISKDLQRQIYENVPVLPILHPESHWGFANDLNGIDPLLISASAQDWSQVGKDGFSFKDRKSVV